MVRAGSYSRYVSRLVVGMVLLAIMEATPGLAFGGKEAKKQDFKRQVQALEEQWRGAQLSGDLVTMDKLLSDDYVGITMTGQVNTKTQQLERARRHLLQFSRLDLIDTKVKLLGQVAIVTSLACVEGTNDGTPVAGNFRYTRIYHHLPSGTWKITNFEATRIHGPGDQKVLSAARDEHPG